MNNFNYNNASVFKDIFTYNAVFSNVAVSGGIQLYNINIMEDADFIVQSATAEARNNSSGAILSNPRALFMLIEGSTGRQLMDTDVPVNNMFGSGQFPFIWPQPKAFAARSTIVVKVTNNDAAVALDLRLSFIGVNLRKR